MLALGAKDLRNMRGGTNRGFILDQSRDGEEQNQRQLFL